MPNGLSSRPTLSHLPVHHWLICLVMLAVGIYRGVLLPAGQNYFPDEVRFHRASEGMLDALVNGNVHDGLWRMFSAQARPGSVLLGMIPALFQRALGGSLVVPGLWNVLVSLALLWVLYRILSAFVPASLYAVGGAALFALIHANSLYIRHLLPYDWALLVFMVAIWIMLRGKAPMRLSRHDVLLCGILCGLGFTVYPGYYPLIGVAALLVMFYNKRRVPTLPLFILGLIVIVGAFQLISQAVGVSYLRAALEFSSTIIQGDFSEGYTFGVSYLAASEGIYGALWILLFGAAVVLNLLRRGTTATADPRIRAIVLLALLAYLGYGTLAVVFHGTVIYGRLVHMFIPFLVIGVVQTLISIDPPRLRTVAWGLLLAVGAVAFVWNAALYVPLEYPKDVLRQVSAAKPGAVVCAPVIEDGWTMDELQSCDLVVIDYYSPGQILSDLFVPHADWQLLYQGQHPASYVPYQFESYSPQERIALQTHPKLLSVYYIPR